MLAGAGLRDSAGSHRGLARLDGDGQLDARFGTSGVLAIEGGTGNELDDVYALRQLLDVRLVLGGLTFHPVVPGKGLRVQPLLAVT